MPNTEMGMDNPKILNTKNFQNFNMKNSKNSILKFFHNFNMKNFISNVHSK